MVVALVVVALAGARACLRAPGRVVAWWVGRVVEGGLVAPCLLLLLASTAVVAAVVEVAATAARVASCGAALEAWGQRRLAVVAWGLGVALQARLSLRRPLDALPSPLHRAMVVTSSPS